MMSYMYSLLNYVAATSKEISAGPNSGMIGTSPYMHSDDRSTTRSVETGLHGYSEDEKRLIGISTISVVTRLALEFDDEEVCYLFYSYEVVMA
jgi:phosphatidylinositol 4-kinase